MEDMPAKKQQFIGQIEKCVGAVRTCLLGGEGGRQYMAEAVATLAEIGGSADGASRVSFVRIGCRLEALLKQNIDHGQGLRGIDLEVAALAADWLEQLAGLYAEDLPEPRSLVENLLDTFDLVESCNEATSLAELLRVERSDRRMLVKDDPFAGDPLLDVTGKTVVKADPFAEDPGFGVAFDLLHRTLNGVAFKKEPVSDPFQEDPKPSVETAEIASGTKNDLSGQLPYDVFAEDPSPEGRTDA